MSGLALYEEHLCCAICGDAILPPTPDPSQLSRWRTEAILLSDPDQEFEQLERHYRGGKRRDAPRLNLLVTQQIRKDRARVIGGDRLQILSSDKQGASRGGDPEWVQANNSYICGENGLWAETPYYIATHGGCLEVAEEVMRRSPHNIIVRDLRTLWKVIRMRFEVNDSHHMSTATGAVARSQRIRLPHGYYMPFRPSPVTSWQSPGGQDNIDGSISEAERWEASYPLSMPDMTSAILENLRFLPPATVATPGAISFQQQFLALPPELRDHICSFLVSRHGLPGACSGRLPHWVWRDVLLGGKCLPFLPEIDVRAVEDFCTTWDGAYQGREPNWELLVRRLSQESWSIWDAESSSLDVPNGLRNRRRIWKLVEEMYVGELVPVQRTTHQGIDSVAVPRYWDKTGALVHPVNRVNAGSRDIR
ncbi:hypothetical protein GGR53DRAFT_215118 [Hypoxylon sp. FL1150]|nr:hypothetical protein GGR53DRAFT_215118 [Hypoxylon sp. FL1150]